jgi:ribosomal protein S18 acetylase RimI-like enzyme
MTRATKNDKAAIIDILCKSFLNNQRINLLIVADKKREQRVRAFMEYNYELATHYGDIWLSDDKTACALTLDPSNLKMDTRIFFLGIKVIIRSIGLSHAYRFFVWRSKLRQLIPKQEATYLLFIAVDPIFRYKGVGGNLLRQLIRRSNLENLRVYTDSASEQDIPWYLKSGFEIYEQKNIGYPLYFLRTNIS